MKPPMCKLCKSPHWPYEEHKITDTVPGYVKEMVAGVMGGRESSAAEAVSVSPIKSALRGDDTLETGATSAVEPSGSPKACNACHKPLHSRGKVCNACRQAAYRERSK